MRRWFWAFLLNWLIAASPAVAQLTTSNVGGGFGAAGAPATTTFDPSNLGTGNSLTGGNLIVTNSGAGGSGYSVARSLTSHSSGKYYYEFTINSNGGSASLLVAGIANASTSLSSNYLGVDTTSAGAFGSGGGWFVNNGSVASTPAYGLTTIGIAVDYDNHLIWLVDTASPSTWNGGAGAAPGGTGGGSIAAITCPCYAAVGIHQSIAGQVTANFGATAYAIGSAPSGFTTPY